MHQLRRQRCRRPLLLVVLTMVFSGAASATWYSIVRDTRDSSCSSMSVSPDSPVGDIPDFFRAMQSFPWSDLRVAMKERSDHRKPLLAEMIHVLTPFIIQEPREPILPKCSVPPPLPDIDCSGMPDVFSGRRDKPARVAHMIPFGFEVDVLEIHLRELYDIVDFFFILESTRAQAEQLGKPLIWERVKNQDRFRIFQDKVVHILVDDIESIPNKDDPKATSEWYMEEMQERRRFTKFLEWNEKQTVPFSDDDIIGFGDTDEVAWRNNVHSIKFCKLVKSPVDIGIWFPSGTVDTAFRTDFPVPGHPYTLGDPTFHTLGAAKALLESGETPSRNRGKSGRFLLGGMHMSRHRYLPHMMVDPLTCTECVETGPQTLVNAVDVILSNDFGRLQEYWEVYHSEGLRPRTVSVESIGSEAESIRKIPWFLECNPNRYPYWWGGTDLRLTGGVEHIEV
jgi:hypothetical protein